MRKKMPSLITTSLLILALFTAIEMNFELAPIVMGGTIYVPNDYPTIQEAIDAAIDGDTIYVYNGTYNEDVNISKSIGLIGESRDGTIIKGSGNYTINVSYANNTHIDKFWIKGKNSAKGYDGGDGIVIEKSTVILENLKVEGGTGGEMSEVEVKYFEGGIGVRCYNSTLNITNSIIYGGDGINGLDDMGGLQDINDYGNGGNGSEALLSIGSEITFNNCQIQGGNGGDGGYGGQEGNVHSGFGKKGGDGGNGGDSVSVDLSELILIKTSIFGGNGGKGGDGGGSYPPPAVEYGGIGGNGGIGGKALLSKNSNLSIEGTDIYGGNGGIAGNGGYGDRSGLNGGIGGPGGDGLWSLKSTVLVLNGKATSGTGGSGGKGGGHGGSGGGGGNGGKGLVGNQSTIHLLNVTLTTGAGGNGGDNGSYNNDGSGGNGGNGGTGLHIKYSNLSLEEIKINTGNGGIGGIGGYSSQAMAMGSEESGGKGGNGGNGGDSVVIFYSNLTANGIVSNSGEGKNGGYGGESVNLFGGDGGTGGNGGSTIVGIWSTLFIENANMTAGNAGNGSYGGEAGDAGDSIGGNGGKGGDGGKMFFDNSTATFLFSNITAGNGGNGGDAGSAGKGFPEQKGGDGGDGGIGGDGIYAINSNVTLENSTLTCGYGGLGGTNGSGFTPGVKGSDGRDGTIYIDPSHIVFLNSMINGGDSESPIILDGLSSIEFMWYIHIGVVNATGLLVRNADVIVKDNANGTFEEVFSTDSEGYARWIIVTEYIETLSGRIYFTPHNITTTFDGNVSYVVPEPWVNQSMEIVSILSELKDYILLDNGWNLISIPRIQSDTFLQTVLEPLDGQYDAVQWYNTTDNNDPWEHYHISKPSYMNDLKNLNHNVGFWIHIIEPSGTTFLMNGSKPFTSQFISLLPGWNLVGYPSLTSYNRTEGLNNLTFGSEVDSIWTYDATTQKWKELGPLDYFEIGKGYWIHTVNKCTWEVPL